MESKKISKAQMATLPKIVAVDFDGTLVTDCYPEIGLKDEAIFRLLIDLQASGVKLILWTCRHTHFLDAAVEFCASHGLVFDAVNRNIDEVIAMFNNDGRKVYADWYLDDKNADLSCLELFALLKNLSLEDGEPCGHRGCLSHITHPCEGCGRIAGRRVYPEAEVI